MEPLVIAVAACAYVAAEIAKKSADSLITAAYNRLRSYLFAKAGENTGAEKIDSNFEQLNATKLRNAGLATDPQLANFGREVMARSLALRRAQLVESVLNGARVLWIDDQPENNLNELHLLQAFATDVKQARSTAEAIDEIARNRFDLLLSDISRDGRPEAGLEMLSQLPRWAPPVIFYVGQVDPSRPVPRGAFGIADSPESLLHLVLDGLERCRV